jgi:hypothetical protein
MATDGAQPRSARDPAHDAGHGAWRYDSFVVRVTLLPAGVVGMVRLLHVRTGEVRHVKDLSAALREIDARIAWTGAATPPGWTPPGWTPAGYR